MDIDEKIEQRIVIKFLVKSGKTNSKICNMLTAVYSNKTISHLVLYEWIGQFQEGSVAVVDNPPKGRPVTTRSKEMVARVQTTISEDCRKTRRDVASSVGTSHESTTLRKIFREDLNLRKFSLHMVPQVLTEDQKADRIHIICDWLVADESDDISSCVITGVESWVFEYDLVKKRADMVWLTPDEPRVKKARRSKSQIKCMATDFFDQHGLIMLNWMPMGSTITRQAYIETMKKLRERICKKQPELCQSNLWILYHNNGPAHRCFVVSQFLVAYRAIMLEHPAYSPDLAPCNFFLIDKIKDAMRGTLFGSVEAVKAEAARLLKAIPASDWTKCFERAGKTECGGV